MLSNQPTKLSHTSSLKTGTLVAALSDSWHITVCTRTGWSGVSILWLIMIAWSATAFYVTRCAASLHLTRCATNFYVTRCATSFYATSFYVTGCKYCLWTWIPREKLAYCLNFTSNQPTKSCTLPADHTWIFKQISKTVCSRQKGVSCITLAFKWWVLQQSGTRKKHRVMHNMLTSLCIWL